MTELLDRQTCHFAKPTNYLLYNLYYISSCKKSRTECNFNPHIFNGVRYVAELGAGILG